MTVLLGTLYEIKWRAIQVYPYLEGFEGKWSEKARKVYDQLVDRFYAECEDMLIPQQRDAAKVDFDYFMVLITLAEAYHKEDDEDEPLPLN